MIIIKDIYDCLIDSITIRSVFYYPELRPKPNRQSPKINNTFPKSSLRFSITKLPEPRLQEPHTLFLDACLL